MRAGSANRQNSPNRASPKHLPTAQQSSLAGVLDCSSDAVIAFDAQERMVTWNQSATALFGHKADQILGESPERLLEDATGLPAWRALREAADETDAVRDMALMALTSSGERISVEVTYKIERGADKRELGSAMILRRARPSSAEQARRSQELAALYAVSEAISQALNPDQALDHALDRVLTILKLDGGRIYLSDAQSGSLSLAVGHGDQTLFEPPTDGAAPAACFCVLAASSPELQQRHELPRQTRIVRSGRRHHSPHACATVPLLSKERILGVLHVVSTQEPAFNEEDLALLRSIGAQLGVAIENMRLREEARRAEALSTLIQEMHHRIKNNLQTVADLLSLEMSTSASPAARKSLRDSVSRIKSIAAVHELLSLEQLRLTDITELARQVCDISLRHLTRHDQKIDAVIEGPPVLLPSKQATALALVMNELISNALEHAFGFGQKGHLVITVAQEGSQVSVSITDDGRGLPPDFDLDSKSGLGLQIARTLVEKDLVGSLHISPVQPRGSCATLMFYK